MEKSKIKLVASWLFVGFLFAASVFAAPEHILISQVLYDPVNTETGGEAVELYNPTNNEINISGYVLKTESAVADATVPLGIVLGAGKYYLIADTGWASVKDNSSWPNADHEEAISLTNTDAGIALVVNGSIIDSVGWGNPVNINAGLFEQSPLINSVEGLSLQRFNLSSDLENNSLDFFQAEPSFHNSSSGIVEVIVLNESDDGTISLHVDVSNEKPFIENLSLMDENFLKNGVQIIPLPGERKLFNGSFLVGDSDNNLVEVSVSILSPSGVERNISTSFTIVSGNLRSYFINDSLDFYEEPGFYTLEVSAMDKGNERIFSNLSFEYLAMAALSVDASSLNFDNATVGEYTSLLGDISEATLDTPTIRNLGNVPINIGLYGTNLTDGSKLIAVENVKYSLDNDFGSDLSSSLSSDLRVVNVNLTAGLSVETPLAFQLFVPSETENGNYLGEVHVVAVN